MLKRLRLLPLLAPRPLPLQVRPPPPPLPRKQPHAASSTCKECKTYSCLLSCDRHESHAKIKAVSALKMLHFNVPNAANCTLLEVIDTILIPTWTWDPVVSSPTWTRLTNKHPDHVLGATTKAVEDFAIQVKSGIITTEDVHFLWERQPHLHGVLLPTAHTMTLIPI